MPGAPKPTVLDAVHSSCKAVVEAQQWVSLVPEAIQAYAAQLDAAAVRAGSDKAGLMFPIKTDSQEAEVTFLALYHLLDFGSGYDSLLRSSSAQRGWRETLQYGCFGLALAAKRLDGPWMRSFSLYNLHTAFGFDSKVETQLQPGITISKPGPLAPLAQSIHSTVVEAGQALEAAGAKSLGALIIEHLDGLKAAGKPITAASLVEELSDSIPGFQDSALFTPTPTPPAAAADAAPQDGSSSSMQVVFLRKAQALAAALALRFGREDPRFAFEDMQKLAADSGATLPAVLHKLGLITYSDSLTAALQQQQQQQLLLPPGPEERALRAAAVAAVDAVVAAAAAAGAAADGSGDDSSGAGGVAQGLPFAAHELSGYLLGQVKEEGEGAGGKVLFAGEALHPFATLGTIAY